jgi:hypothetical protein
VSLTDGFLTLLGKILHIQRQFLVKIAEIIFDGCGKSFNLALKTSILISRNE